MTLASDEPVTTCLDLTNIPYRLPNDMLFILTAIYTIVHADDDKVLPSLHNPRCAPSSLDRHDSLSIQPGSTLYCSATSQLREHRRQIRHTTAEPYQEVVQDREYEGDKGEPHGV